MDSEDFKFEQDRPSTKPRFDGTINLGHLLTALMMGAALVTMWANSKVVEAQHDSRITTLEKSQARIDETLRTLADNATASNRTQDRLSLTLDYLAKQIPAQAHP